MNSAIQECHIVQDRHASSRDATEYHRFAFTVPNTQGESPVMNNKRPKDVEIVKICHMLEERFKSIEGRDTYGLDTLILFLVINLVIPPKFKTPYLRSTKGLVVHRII